MWLIFSSHSNSIACHNFKHRSMKDHWPYPYHDQDAKPQSGTFQWSPKLKSGCDLKNEDVLCKLKINLQPKFKSSMYQRQLNTSKSWSGCQTLIRNLQCPPKLQTGHDVICTFNFNFRSCIYQSQNMLKMPIPNYESPVSSKDQMRS